MIPLDRIGGAVLRWAQSCIRFLAGARRYAAGPRSPIERSGDVTMAQQQPTNEKELLRLQIQAYEFYAGLIDRAVTKGAHEAIMPKWDEQRAQEYKQLAEQLRQRLAELEREDAQSGAKVDASVQAPAR